MNGRYCQRDQCSPWWGQGLMNSCFRKEAPRVYLKGPAFKITLTNSELSTLKLKKKSGCVYRWMGVPDKDWASAQRKISQFPCSFLFSLVNPLPTADLLSSRASVVEKLEATPLCASCSRVGKRAAVCVCACMHAYVCVCVCVCRPLLHTPLNAHTPAHTQ